MKKLLFLGVAAAMAMSATAQQDVVKSAKKDFKEGDNISKLIEAMTPAFSNPETANSAETYFIVGDAGFKNYDYYLNLYRLGQEIDQANMGRSLVRGYEFFNKALPLDSVPDEKGKVKPKYAKKMLEAIADHHDDFNTAGAMLWGAKDYPAAYEAWDIYLSLPNDARLGKKRPAPLADTIASTISFNKGLAAWQADMLPKALDAFDQAIALNYDDAQIFEYAAEVARQLGDQERQFSYARKGFEVTKNPKYLSMQINHYLDKEDFATAKSLLDQAISSTDDNRQKAYLYVLNGIIAERTDPEAAKGNNNVIDNYTTATQLDPTYGGAFYNLGRMQLIQANELDENNTGSMNQAEYNAYKKSTLLPLLNDAAANMEKGYELDNSLTPALNLLQQIYYMLGDEQNLQRIKALQEAL